MAESIVLIYYERKTLLNDLQIRLIISSEQGLNLCSRLATASTMLSINTTNFTTTGNTTSLHSKFTATSLSHSCLIQGPIW
jgi:hypothetical protein